MISLLTHVEGDLNAMDSSSTLPFDIVLDSGAVDYVADNHDAPG